MGKNFIRHDINGRLLKLWLSFGVCLCLVAALPQAAFADEAEISEDPVTETISSTEESLPTTPQTAAEEAANLWTQMEKETDDNKSDQLAEQYSAAMNQLNQEEQAALQGQLTLNSEDTSYSSEPTWVAIDQGENNSIVIGGTTSSELTDGSYYYLNGNIETATSLSVSGNVRLNLNGNTLKNTSGDAIVLNSNANLYLTDVTAHGTEDSGSIVAESGYAVNGDSGAYVHLCCDSSMQSSSYYPINGVYVTNSDETMAYRQVDSTIDIKGYYNGSWIQTTYSGSTYGYEMAAENLGNAAITVSASFVNGGKYIQLNYNVAADKGTVNAGKLAVYADVQIGDNDYATVQVIKDGNSVIGLKMVDTHTSCTSSQAQFNLYFDGTGGVTPVDTYWFGQYGERTAHKFDALTSSTASTAGIYGAGYSSYSSNSNSKESRSGDSGFALSWQNIALAKGESETFSFILGVGKVSSPISWGSTSSDSSENTATNKEDYLSVTVDDNSSKLVISTTVNDPDGAADKLLYAVDGGGEKKLATENVSEGSVTLASTIDVSTLSVGTHQLSFWVVNDLGALSPYVVKTVTVSENNGVKTAAVSQHGLVYTAQGDTITENCVNGCTHSATAIISGEDCTYNGEAHNATITKSDTWDGQDPHITYGDNGNVNAGEVTALATMSGAVASTTYTIAKAKLTVTAQSASKLYGEADPELSYEIEGLVAGDDIKVLMSREESDKVGEYDISIVTCDAGSNYEVITETEDSKFTIEYSDNLIEYDTIVDGENRHLWVNAKDEVVQYQDEGSSRMYYLGGYEADYYYQDTDFTPTLIEGDGSVFDNSSSMPFRSDDSICNFQKVLINGKELSSACYDVTEGSIRVTLKAAYLNSLEPGTYTIQIISSNGDASGEFTIPYPEPTLYYDKTATPRTGDSSSLGLWLALMCFSAVGFAAVLLGLRKKAF